MRNKYISTIKYLLIVVILALSTTFLLGGNKAHAMVLNPYPQDPNTSGWNYAFGIPPLRGLTLALCDQLAYNTDGKTPGFTTWISPVGNSASDLSSGFINAKPGDVINLRYNWAGAVCFNYSNVVQTSARFLPSPGITGLPATTFLNFTSYFGPTNFNSVGAYRLTYSDFSWTVPPSPPGTQIGDSVPYQLNINLQAINHGRAPNDFYQCVGGAEQYKGGEFDFGNPYNPFENPCVSNQDVMYVNVKVGGTKVEASAGNCQALTGNVTSSEDLTAVGLMYTDATNTVEIGRTDINIGSNVPYSIPMSEQFKDGQSHRYQVRFYKRGTGVQLAVANGTQTACPSNAQCAANFAANVQETFPGNVSSLQVGDTTQIKVTMTNTGQSIWSNYAGYGNYQLSLPAGAIDDTWDLSGNVLSGPVRPIDGQRDVTFLVTVKLMKQPTSAATPLGFQMAFVPSSGAPTLFGAACLTTLRIESAYAPWLRVQNGSTASRGQIIGQPASSRGMRDTIGTNQNIDLETTYAVVSVVSASNFCSTNAYNYGRDSATLSFRGVNGGVVSNCSSGAYPFTVSTAFDGPAETLYNNAETLRTSAGQCAGEPNPLKPETRYKNGGATGASGAIAAVDNCPTLFSLSGGTLAARTITRGRVAIIVDGDLNITSNIVADFSSASLNLRPPLVGGDVAEMVKAQNNALGAIPSLGIIVKGNLTIDKDVDRIDAMIYAGGKINTCSAYPGVTTGKQTAAVASQCARRLTVRGGLYALGGFTFGRNWFDVGRITGRTGVAVGDPSFDYKLDADAPQGPYSGGPAEDIIGSGLGLFATPPGFEDINSSKFNHVSYQDGDFAPRF